MTRPSNQCYWGRGFNSYLELWNLFRSSFIHCQATIVYIIHPHVQTAPIHLPYITLNENHIVEPAVLIAGNVLCEQEPSQATSLTRGSCSSTVRASDHRYSIIGLLLTRNSTKSFQLFLHLLPTSNYHNDYILVEIPYLPMYKSIPCISWPPILKPKISFSYFWIRIFFKNVSFILEFFFRYTMFTQKICPELFLIQSFQPMCKPRVNLWTNF